jgi:hypothetical protein
VVLVAGLLVLGLVFAIAAWFVVREAGRLAFEPPPVVFSLDEAYEWVVEELPDEVAATLTPEDVRRIIDFQVEYFDRAGVAANGSNGSAPGSEAPAIVGAAEVVDYVLARAAERGDPYIPEQVYPVVEILLAYLAATGAVSTPADPDPPLAP